MKINRHSPREEVRDVIHGGDEAKGREGRQPTHQQQGERRSDVRVPGPFWIRQRPDERKETECSRRRQFEHDAEGRDVTHGGEAYGGGRRDEDRRYPNDLNSGRRGELVFHPDPTDEPVENEEDEAISFPFRKPCECGPGPTKSGPDKWMLEHDWGKARPGRAPKALDEEEPVGERTPVARVSCAPQTDIANADQPNAFMRQLYKKYPYLYQVLRETPPEELASRVFKDKFLSTYQVDYLHMGIGQERIPEGGAQVQERITGPDGEPEPQAIPGCSYRHGEKGDFGRKKQEENKREMKAPVEETHREEPRISEYQATISRLGNEIITDQLYRIAQITKNMKNQYKRM